MHNRRYTSQRILHSLRIPLQNMCVTYPEKYFLKQTGEHAIEVHFVRGTLSCMIPLYTTS